MKIQYCHCLLENIDDAVSVRPVEVSFTGLPDHIRNIIKNHKSFAESNTFGRSGLGSPEEYEQLIVSDGNTTKTFIYLNKAVHFITTGTEDDRPVFQVFAHLMAQARSGT